MYCPPLRPFTTFAIVCAIGLTLVFHSSVFATNAVSTGKIAAGTRWETPYYIIDSGVVGETVLVTGGIHGNEPAGYRAAEQIRHWPIAKGRLVVVPGVNRPGLQASTRYLPDTDKPHHDLNRNFIIGEDGQIITAGTLATELWQLVERLRPNWIIDLHEGYQFYISHRPAKGKNRSVGSSIIYHHSDSLDPLVRRALATANAHVDDSQRRFVALDKGPVKGSLASTAHRALGANTFIIETTYQNQPLSLRTRQQRAMVNSLLNDIGLLDRDCSKQLTPNVRQGWIQVGLFDGPGTGSGGKQDFPRIVDQTAGMQIHFIGVEDIQPALLSQFDVLLFPGGSGSKQARAIGSQGREHVRAFVQDGGGYLGVCAGAYLCSDHYAWSLDLVDAEVFTGAKEIPGVGRKQMWYRGNATRVQLELSEAGKRVFTDVAVQFDVRYHNGPILSPNGNPEIEDYTPLAWFRSEQVRYDPQRGTMVDTPAIVSGRFQDGRVISISPHPEADEALQSMIVDAIRWCAQPE
ncbi:BPL-N domain-containing protein [Roseimaritima ulvae]|uniref:Succinylglutamate desuccinylase / Aspartoacylase family protein n=1 Tax=Roseimaritima ulvae TaxID=980254 RepID=A0A5B9QMW8_9BACT|nr:BPL-N domain-containing protein [Roseimaritima ulvae]QEG39212.1 Succinylglutamate desuccinylase / Aspartoacylase family protein [Roseimaritima ulvae]